jgi:hypothetical protein
MTDQCRVGDVGLGIAPADERLQLIVDEGEEGVGAAEARVLGPRQPDHLLRRRNDLGSIVRVGGRREVGRAPRETRVTTANLTLT